MAKDKQQKRDIGEQKAASSKMRRKELVRAIWCHLIWAYLGEGRPSKTGQIRPVSNDTAAEMLDVNPKMVERTKTVQKRGTPGVIAPLTRRKTNTMEDK